MKIILFCLFILISVELQAQAPSKPIKSPFDISVNRKPILAVDFLHSDNVNVNLKYNPLIDSAFHLDKNYDFELRFSSRYMFKNADNVFILRLDKGNWSARYFDFKDSNEAEPNKITERPIDQSKLRELWTRLVYNDILSLPNGNTLERRYVKYEIDSTLYRVVGNSMRFSDGVLYGFELAAPGKKRDYLYGNPEGYHKYFPHVEEVAKVSLIIRLIDMYLQRTGIRK